MKSWQALLMAPALALSQTSFDTPDWNELLGHDDWQKMAEDRERGPELSGPISEEHPTPEWESYNELNCFPTTGIELECTEIDDDGLQVPTLRVRERDQTIDFSMDPEPDMDCSALLTEWKSLLADEGGFCAYAAFLQDLEPDGELIRSLPWSLWIVSGLKTSKGYWP